jgi:hypothetical protein
MSITIKNRLEPSFTAYPLKVCYNPLQVCYYYSPSKVRYNPLHVKVGLFPKAFKPLKVGYTYF